MSNYVGNVPVQPVGVKNGSSTPASGYIGELFYNTSSDTLFVFNGVSWEEAVGGDNISSGTSLPSSVTVGQLFFQTSQEKLYVGTTSDWEPLQGASSGSGLPVSGNTGDLFLDTGTSLLYIWTGSSWTQVGGASNVNSGSSTPGSGSGEGELFFNTTSGELLVWDGTSWNVVSGTSGSSLIQTGTSLPATGVSGELFFETTNNTLNVWDGAAWVSLMPGATSVETTLPASGDVGEMIYNSSDGNVYVWDGAAWVIVGGTATQSSVVTGDPLPASGSAGDLFFQTSDNTLYVWDGTEWVSLQSTGTGVTVGTTFPSSPAIADLFFNSNDDELFVYTSTGWVSLTESVANSGTSFPSSPTVGQTFYNTSENVLYIWDGSNWIPFGGGSSNELNVETSTSLGQTATTSYSDIFVASSTSGRRYILTSLHATNISVDEATISTRIDYTGTTDASISSDLPVPVGSSVELLKNSKIMNPTDSLQIKSNQNGSVSIVATYNDVADTKLFGIGAKILNTTTNTVYSAPSKARIDSILLTNVGSIDTAVSVSWTNSANAVQAFFTFEMLVPANGTIEVLQGSKILPLDHRIRVEADQENSIDVHIAGKL